MDKREEPHDEYVVEQVIQDLSARCNQSMICIGAFYSCERYMNHPGRCKGNSSANGNPASWWGKNQPDIPGTEGHVWLINGSRQSLTSQGRPNVPWLPFRNTK